MEKLDADLGIRCDQCNIEGVDCVKLDFGDNICRKCLYKALIVMRPIDFDKQYVSNLIASELSKHFTSGYKKDLVNFIELIAPFLKEDN